MKISRITAREITDSRGKPTIETTVFAENFNETVGVPSGTSAGKYEALELRDADGHVSQAIKNINETIAPALIGTEVEQQEALDNKMRELDATPNKSKLGANAILGVSLAAAKCAAASQEKDLCQYVYELAFKHSAKKLLMPVPHCVLIEGGKHGPKLSIQEFMVMPVGAKTFYDAISAVEDVQTALGNILPDKKQGLEGGFVAANETRQALDFIMRAVEDASHKDIFSLALDVAASELEVRSGELAQEGGAYLVDGKKYSTGELLDFYADLVKTYPIASIEDPFSQDDQAGFVEITKKLKRTQIVGDDLFVTNAERIKTGIAAGACNSIILKPNQIGTLSESINAAKVCYENNYGVVVSHRSGETTDTTIADLVVGLCCGQLKSGAPLAKERKCKYDRVADIESTSDTAYAGKSFRTAWKKFI